jgi:hypothetical protein
MAFIAAADRKPASDDAEAAALLRSMFAYTGKFTLEPGKWITTVEFSSTQVNIGDPQVRYYSLDGDKLTVRTPEQNSLTTPGKRTIGVLTAEREK